MDFGTPRKRASEASGGGSRPWRLVHHVGEQHGKLPQVHSHKLVLLCGKFRWNKRAHIAVIDRRIHLVEGF